MPSNRSHSVTLRKFYVASFQATNIKLVKPVLCCVVQPEACIGLACLWLHNVSIRLFNT